MKLFARCNEALAGVLGKLWSALSRGLEPLMLTHSISIDGPLVLEVAGDRPGGHPKAVRTLLRREE
jgi:hypothetical protein